MISFTWQTDTKAITKFLLAKSLTNQDNVSPTTTDDFWITRVDRKHPGIMTQIEAGHTKITSHKF